MSEGRQSNIFYGWYIVGACFIALFVQAGIGFYAFGAFFSPLEQEFHWTRAEIAGAMSVINVMFGLGGPFVGRLADVFGPRKVMAIGAAILGFCLMALYGVSSLWQYYTVFLISALPRVALSPITIGLVISNWFQRHRGLAMGMAAFGIGVGGMTMAPLASYLISLVGWRWATVILGAITIVATVPAVAIIVRRTPQEMGLRPLGLTAEDGQMTGAPAALGLVHAEESITFRQALKTASFWLISVAFFLIFLGQGSILVHIVPFFEDRGESPQIAAAILAFTAGIGGVGKLAMGYVSDKIPARFGLAICFISQIVGMVIIMLPVTAITVPAFVLVFGLGMGGVLTLSAIIAMQTYGTGSLATIMGGLGVLSTISTAGGPVLAGYIFDTTGSYNLALWIFIAAALAAAVIIVFAKPEIEASKDVEKAVA